MTCQHCGAENEAGFKFCGTCGVPLFKPPASDEVIQGTITSAHIVPPEVSDVDLLYPCRWVLGNEPEVYKFDEEGTKIGMVAKHCEACLKFAGEYENYHTMLETTYGAEPGCFPGYDDISEEPPYVLLPHEVHPSRGKACGSMCTCHLEFKIDGKWQHV